MSQNESSDNGEPKVYIVHEEGGRPVVYGTFDQVMEKAKENPEILPKLRIGDGDAQDSSPHSFLKELFDRSIEDPDKKDLVRGVLSTSLEIFYSDVTLDNRRNTDHFLAAILDKKGKGSYLDLFKAGLDYTTVNHSINIAALAANIYDKREKLIQEMIDTRGQYDSFIDDNDREKAIEFLNSLGNYPCIDIVRAALYHDIGKSEQRELFEKKESFTDPERELMKKHPLDGVKLMRKSGINETIILSGAHNHHRRINDTGYPAIDSNMPPTEFDYMLGLFDSFEAMTSKVREYSKGMLPRDAMGKLLKEIHDGGDKPIFYKHHFLILAASLSTKIL